MSTDRDVSRSANAARAVKLGALQLTGQKRNVTDFGKETSRKKKIRPRRS
jgi:hypothetical protein